MSVRRPRIVVLGMMTKMPVAGVVWQNLHYLLGFEGLGYETWYVEAHAINPSAFQLDEHDPGSQRAAAYIDAQLRPFGFGDRWAYHALHHDGACFGMNATALLELYASAELIVNLHGGTMPQPEHAAGGRLVYLETDPVALQVELHEKRRSTIEFLEPHVAFFTFGESYGQPGCGLPVNDRFAFRPTRQPVVVNLWEGRAPQGTAFRTVGSFRQRWRTVELDGESYLWSKDQEWAKVVELPARTGCDFELAISGYRRSDEKLLTQHGWHVQEAAALSADVDAYRDFIAGSLAEFTVAKDQNIRLRSGWFSDRSATYLAAGRPVITQDTGFGQHFPVGEGLFAFSDLESAVAAVEAVAADPKRHAKAAYAIAREHFEAEVVLRRLLDEVGLRSHRITRSSSVCALVPYFDCEPWLGGALESLLGQTRPLDAIVVIDDGSEEPPIDVVAAHPEVTLLRAPDNGGPYRLIQAVIDATDYDAYLFQDADDWSAPDRLEVLLATAEETGAELVGSHEVRVLVDQGDMLPVTYPLDVNEALQAKPTAFPLLHPTSLVARTLLERVGGFATGMRFSGDAEFLRRAGHVAKVVNADHFGYFRRKRTGSLTTDPTTGLNTPQRLEVQAALAERARENADAVAAGDEPDLKPWRVAEPVTVEYLAGPALGSTLGRRAALAPVDADGPVSPVFVIGSPRGGHALVAWALDQHPSFRAVPDARWLARAAVSVAGRAVEDAVPAPATFVQVMADALADAVGIHGRWVAAGTDITEAAGALALLFPEARFVFVARDVEGAVADLLANPTEGGAYYTRDSAYRRWVSATRSALDLEAALGVDRVHRVDYMRLLAEPDKALTEVTEFLGEDSCEACARPLLGVPRPTRRALVHEEMSPAISEQVTELVFRLAEEPPAVAPAGGVPDSLLRRPVGVTGGGSLVERVRALVVPAVPDGAVVLVASKGDDRLVDLFTATGWHFPQAGDGTYAGHYPADSEEAVTQLEELRARGAEYLVFPATGFWWLTHYAGLRAHLDDRYRVVAYQEDTAVVYVLSTGDGPSLVSGEAVLQLGPTGDGGVQ